MLTSKERAELRSRANGLETTLIVGKGGVTEQVVLEAVTQLEARELIKGRALEASFLTAREALDALCAATGAEPVCAVGFRFVLYRESERERRNAYFRQTAIDRAIEREKEKAMGRQEKP